MSNRLLPESDASEDGRSSTVARPWWLAFCVAAVGAVWLYGAFSLPQTAQYARIGPGLFVTIIGVALLALGALLAWQIAQGEEFKSQDCEDALADAPADTTALLTAIAAAALPLLIMRPLGFPLTAALSFALIARAFGSRRPVMDVSIGAAIGLIAYFGFLQLGVALGGLLPILDL